ncbi:MAG: hypothetical protein M1822_006367 [Bathelium mastoideum]|nr:MAG: hypothetical protein M1822_006367 [Bathelium mastoideum]
MANRVSTAVDSLFSEASFSGIETHCPKPNRVSLKELDISIDSAFYFDHNDILAMEEEEACASIRNIAILVAKQEKHASIWAHKVTADHGSLSWAINRTDRVQRKSVESSSRSRSVSPVKQPRRPHNSRSAHTNRLVITEMCKTPSFATARSDFMRLWDFEDLFYLIGAKIRALYDDLKLRLANFDGLRHVVLHNHGYSCDDTDEPCTYMDMALFLALQWTALQDPRLVKALDLYLRAQHLGFDPLAIGTRVRKPSRKTLRATGGLANTNALPVAGVIALLWTKTEAQLDREQAEEARWVAARLQQQQEQGGERPVSCACAADATCACRALCATQPELDCLCRVCPAFLLDLEAEKPAVPPKMAPGVVVALGIVEGLGMDVEWEEEGKEKWWKKVKRVIGGCLESRTKE